VDSLNHGFFRAAFPIAVTDTVSLNPYISQTILSARVKLSAEEYEPFLKGTQILTLEEARKIFAKGDAFTSIYGSSKIVDDFNVANKVYDKPQAIESYIDPSITTSL